MDRLLHVKRDLAQDMLNGSGDVGPGDFSLDDMLPANDQGSGLSPPVTIDDVVNMKWEYFEWFVAALWLKKGFKTVYKTPMQDGGIDVVGISGDSGVLILRTPEGVEAPRETLPRRSFRSGARVCSNVE